MRLRRKERAAQEAMPEVDTAGPADTPVSGFKIQEPAAKAPKKAPKKRAAPEPEPEPVEAVVTVSKRGRVRKATKR